nr:DNA-directed RNA polymerase III subunit rpc3 isoform X1 [Ipomoea batatas]
MESGEAVAATGVLYSDDLCSSSVLHKRHLRSVTHVSLPHRSPLTALPPMTTALPPLTPTAAIFLRPPTADGAAHAHRPQNLCFAASPLLYSLVRRLAMEVRSLASARPITVLNGVLMILQMPRDKLTGELSTKYKQLMKVRIAPESALMNLDDAIMLFHDF